MIQNLKDDPIFAVLFNPLRDAKKSWNIDIANIMTTFLNNVIANPEQVNFVSAALLIQASSSIYGKKVEDLYVLVQKFAQTISNIKKSKAHESTKDKDLQHSRVIDEFTLVNLKRSKNLDMVDENVTNIHSKNAVKYLPSIPPDLIHMEESEKGDINLIDSRGDIIGNKKDFFLNICRIDSSGYLLLPTVNASCVPKDFLLPLHTNEVEPPAVEANRCDDDNAGSFGEVEMYDSPAHSSVPEENVPSPPPVPDIFDDVLPALESRRRSMRQIEKSKDIELNLKQLKAWQTSNVEEDNASKRKIQKKNTRKLPKKLKKKSISGANMDDELNPTSQFCSETFFSMDSKFPKNGLPKNDIKAFEELFVENAQRQTQDFKSYYKTMNINDENEIENDNAPESDEDHSPVDNDCLPSYDDDIPIEQSGGREDCDIAIDSNVEDLPVSTNYEDLVRKHIADYMKDVEQYSQTTDISKSVRQWEDSIRPILEEQQTHEPFDIYIYGKRIIDSFVDNNRKQMICFQEFCQDKETWQVHRYFLASLQLANNYNIKLTLSEEEDHTLIYLTLLSRKQHHEEIAEFGHSLGSHCP